jgi:hypothetical protein
MDATIEAVPATTEAHVEERSAGGLGAGRFRNVCIAVTLAAAVPYLWALWDLWSGSVNPLRVDGAADSNPIYAVQARAIMQGHLWIPPGSIAGEAFVAKSHEWTYFGLFPSLIRIPVFLFTSSLDDRLTAPSLLCAWLVTALFSSLLLWRLRVFLRGSDVALGWAEAVSYGFLLATILVGSVLVFLASVPDTYSEDLAWSVALACGSFFALVGVLEKPGWGRVTACGVLVLLTNLNRATTGYAAVGATLLIAIWFALGRAGPERRRWAVPVAVAGLVPMLVGCAIDLAKFGELFGVPASSQLLYKELGYAHLDGGQYWGLRYLPSTLQAYVDPLNFRFTSLFPFITLPDLPAHPVAHTALFSRTPTANIPVSMPLLFALGVLGVIVAFTPGRSVEFRGLRILLIMSVLTAGSVMIFGWVLERFVADFLPLLILSAMIGMIELWRRLEGRTRRARSLSVTAVAVLALFGIWANLGFASTPNRNWTSTQLTNYVTAQQSISNVTGHPIDNYIVVGSRPPWPASMGTLYIEGRCRRLYLASQGPPPSVKAALLLSWIEFEQAPHAPLCVSLLGDKAQRAVARK